MNHYILFSTILLVFLLIILFNYITNYNYKEPLLNPYQTWSDDLIRRFLEYQETVNLNDYQFNIAILQQQASPEEAEYLLKHGHWPWPNYLKYEFLDFISSNTIIRIDHEVALNNAMKIYNKNAATMLLAWNKKEGQFLLYGVNLGVTNDEIIKQNTIKCSYDTGNMEKITYTGVNLLNGFMNSKTEKIKNKDIPKHIPGFTFVNKPCNPCKAFDDQPNFNCAFKLNVDDNDTISPIWKKIWKL